MSKNKNTGGKTYMKRITYTAESVCEGHPDKLCDLIADAILDECLMEDENARVACEVLATAGKIIVAGEITTVELPDIERIVLQTVEAVGYDPQDYDVEVLVHGQSEDIADGVDAPAEDEPEEQGAGDQGVMYGYATDETPEMLPTPCVLAHRITKLLTVARIEGLIKGLRPDGKAQVSVAYEDGVPKEVTAVVVSVQHDENKDITELENEVKAIVVFAALKDFPLSEGAILLVNPSGRFVLGGPEADTGVTGRKLMVDSYGGFIPHGGGAFSGKDASKVDRSGAYMARYIAKNIVAAKLAKKCLVSLSYAIGVAEPVAVMVDSYGTGVVPDEDILHAVLAVFDCRPAVICEELGLYQPIFSDTTNFGHFGKSYLPWEETDRAGELLDALGR
jgi:S-adenosylmethionine synthetase